MLIRLQGKELELVCRCMFFLLKVHMNQLVATRSMLPVLTSLRTNVRSRLQGLKDLVGFNRAAMGFLKRALDVEITVPVNVAKPKKHKK
jgi:U3 small nucleolar RNA-associated protein 12